jgi:hypothetical protein
VIEIDDFVMLGTTVPETQTRSGRVMVCSAGYSPQLDQLLRVYPLARWKIPHRWDQYRIRLERPTRQDDSRQESWKVCADRGATAHDWVNTHFTQTGTIKREQRATMLGHLIAPSIKALNENRASLGIVVPRAIRTIIELEADHPDSPQLCLFDRDAPPDARFPLTPRLRFIDDDGEHSLMIRDWGVFELLRKAGPAYLCEHLRGALHINHESALLVGNLCNQRNAWLVISVLNGLLVPALELENA